MSFKIQVNGFLPVGRAKADIELIRKVSAKPVKYLVYTHWHFDHNYGGTEYKKAFPSIEIISERKTADFIEINSIYYSKFSTSPNSVRMVDDARLQNELAGGKDPNTNKPFSDEELITRKRTLAQRQNEKKELASILVVKPNRIFDDELSITLGKRKIILKDRGRANSLHDVTIYLPEEKTLFTGDIVVQAPLPYVSCSYPADWISVLKGLEMINASIIVPGHGPVQYDYNYVHRLKNFYSAAVEKARGYLKKGATRDDFLASLKLDEFYEGVWGKSKELSDDDWNLLVQTLGTRAWNSLRGQEFK